MEVLCIKEVMRSKKMNCRDMAKILNISASTVSRVCNGKRKIDLDTLKTFAQALGVDPLDLVKTDEQHKSLLGFIEYRSKIYRIRGIKDIEELQKVISEDRISN